MAQKRKTQVKNMTTEEFIQKAKAVHGDKYDYSKVEYVNAITKVCIICPKHGEFWQRPAEHLRGNGCSKCGHEYVSALRKRTKEWFLEKAHEVHGNKYDYSQIQYDKVTSKVCIICPEHGAFMQTPDHHLQGAGCPECGKLRIANSRKKTTADFISEARRVHGDQYDYSKVHYINSRSKVIIICPKHGEFQQSPANHLNGNSCPVCGRDRIRQLNLKTTEWFLEQAHIVHGEKYDYSKTKYIDSSTKVCIICPEHGEFWQLPGSHLKGHGCIVCRAVGNTKYNKEICLATAKTCNSRVEFFNKYPGMVDYAKRHGIYEECCAHMGTRGNKKRLIYAYEFLDSHAAYIGLTFKMEVRNKRHHKEGAVYDYAQLQKVEIPEPKILTYYMEQEEASKQEGVWLQKYKDEGWTILNRFKTGSLGGQELLDYDVTKIEKSMQGYSKLDDWTKANSSYREYIRQHNLDYLLDKYFPNRMRRIYDNYEECYKAYSACSSIRQVHDKFPGALAAAKRHGWHKELSKLCRSSNVKWTREALVELVSKYKTLKEFKHHHNGAYQMIKRKGWEDLLSPLTRQLHPHYNFTIEQIKTFCAEAGNHDALKANHPEVLSYCWYKKIDIYALMGWKKSHLRPIRLLKDGIVVAIFDSTKEAAQFVGVNNRQLGRYIDKGIEYHGYIWETNK